ncbi:MAG: hypothetical protein ACF8NJ_04360 [Phycisphaerales bacterium JB038]
MAEAEEAEMPQLRLVESTPLPTVESTEASQMDGQEALLHLMLSITGESPLVGDGDTSS